MKKIGLEEHWMPEWLDEIDTRLKDMDEAGSLLEDAAEMTLEISKKFEEAAKLIKKA